MLYGTPDTSSEAVHPRDKVILHLRRDSQASQQQRTPASILRLPQGLSNGALSEGLQQYGTQDHWRGRLNQIL